ncbi:hypothetical protein AB1Y20_014324 [Prymnesium parvum]|uniref:Uncharacterized protein n=1 Tax=Prymnesium parvum TaxID=97485 RepID=A0AB34IFX8_PRYPA
MSSAIMRAASNAGHTKCATAVAGWLEIGEQAEIEDAITAFVPKDQPLRDEVLNSLMEVLKLEQTEEADDSEKLVAVISAVTLKAVQRENQTGRRSVSVAGRVTIDETLDLIKIALIGDSGVGKTCMMLRFVKDQFVSSTRATIGADFATRQLNVDVLNASETSVVQRLTVQVWDTAGQEQFQSLTATYYRKAGGVMIMYDATNRKSFDNLGRWVEDVDAHSEGIVKMIVATKADGSPEVSEQEGRAFAEQRGCLFATTSSKSGDGVLKAFQLLAQHVLASQEVKERDQEFKRLSLSAAQAAPKKGCC